MRGIEISGIEVFHDESSGAERGKNTIFKMKIDGMNVVHLGDLGHALSEGDVKDIGSVDVLFVPVGGYFTIDAAAAEAITKTLNPKVVVPMHYKTEKCGFPIASVDEYTKNKAVKKTDGEFEVTKENLPGTMTTYVLTPIK